MVTVPVVLLSLFQHCGATGVYKAQDFNPRSRVGNDQVEQAFKEYTSDFNPRSRVGND